MVYIIEYKSARYPYSYKFLTDSRGEYATFGTLPSARKKAMKLISDATAKLCVIRGGTEQLVYPSVFGYIIEDRKTDVWHTLNRDGTLGRKITPTHANTIWRR